MADDPFKDVGEGLANIMGLWFGICFAFFVIAVVLYALGAGLQSVWNFFSQPGVAITTLAIVGVLIGAHYYKKYDQTLGQSTLVYKEALARYKKLDIPRDPQAFFTSQLQPWFDPPPALLVKAAVELYQLQNLPIPKPPAGRDEVAHALYRDGIRKKIEAYSHPDFHETLVDTIRDGLLYFASPFPEPTRERFTVTAYDILPDVPETVRSLIAMFYQDSLASRGLFHNLQQQITRNTYRVNEKHLSRGAQNAGQNLLPPDHPGTPQEVVDDYLRDTPLHQLFNQPVPWDIPEHIRFEHTHIVAGTGHGKTQTLQQLILSDLTSDNHPALVIIDSQGDMLQKLSHLALFDPTEGALGRNLVIIDPTDVEHPPALNMFNVNFERINKYGAATREQIINGVIELYDYIFGSLLGAELTQKQSVIFRYIARLMLHVPGATIHDMLKLMQDSTPYQPAIQSLPLGARVFFETDFVHKSFDQTKQQIRRRLLGILENPTLERMFTAPKNRFDMFNALNNDNIVLVNTAKDFLKAERSSMLGRYFIALTLQAALERAALPEASRRPAFLYIDEAAEYFDDNIDDLLNQARKFKLGIVFAHQYLDQLVPTLRASIAANASIKFAGGVSDKDARLLAPDMRTDHKFILAQRKTGHSTTFACHVRNYTDHALSLTIPFGALEREPRMSDAAYDRLIAENRSRLSVAASSPTPRQAAPSSGKEPLVRFNPRPEEMEPWRLQTHDVKIGDFVQWTSNGVNQFKTPRRVEAIQRHQGRWWAFVDGENTGVPVDELTVMPPPTPPSARRKPPASPKDADDWSG